jgi:diguanylate cyclase (GGDEF)-like protein
VIKAEEHGHRPVASQREPGAAERDAAAAERDRRASERDRRAAERDSLLGTLEADEQAPAQGDATSAAAGADRRAAAGDRRAAAADRRAAAIDRRAAAADRERADCDELTGAMRRGSGLEALRLAVDRAHRSGEALTVVFIDVDGLKRINDEHGHAAGDRLLRTAVRMVYAKLRSYDLVIRYGGDEFICVLAGMSLDRAVQRMDAVTKALRRELGRSAITVGLATLEPGEAFVDLVGRADEALYERRAGQRFVRAPPDRGGGA